MTIWRTILSFEEPESELESISVGTRIRLIRDVYRFPDFIAHRGNIGVVTNYFVTFSSSGTVFTTINASMKDPMEGAEEWNNELIWNFSSPSSMKNIKMFLDDVELI